MYSTPIIPQEFEWCVTSTSSHETADRWQSEPPQCRTGIVTIHYRGTTHVAFDFRTWDRILGRRTYDRETMLCSRGNSSAARVESCRWPRNYFHQQRIYHTLTTEDVDWTLQPARLLPSFVERSSICENHRIHRNRQSMATVMLQAFRFCQIKPTVQNVSTY